MCNKPVVSASPEEWKRLGIEVSRKHAGLFPRLTPDSCGRAVRFDRTQVLILTAGDRHFTTVPRVRLSHGVLVRIGMNLITPKDAKGTYQFDVVRLDGKRIAGGVTYRIQMKSAL